MFTRRRLYTYVLPGIAVLATHIILISLCFAQRATFVREVSLGEEGHVSDLVFLPDGRLVVAGDKALYEHTVRVLDPQTGENVKEIEGKFDSGGIHLALAPNGVLVAACKNGSLNAWKPPYDKVIWSDSPEDWSEQ